ncbi:MAG TPA: adenosylmethionine--8-amino-7-oxononanoate transaminase [Baekduia sp.]|uniref:adenosylmethionine--8-amino-7-oxononanoate transaminase n=1 Tax=Baekduia sp. TaxID=2600305 RepID=UPI002D78BEA6|nr:adenosylmethionine--8-amino-7-oxononanoate transaminase [Baekduia sp.]HET6508448.1 adenosylmethionine--8-amino-7-oxononanoate transaminase [Baekduia sp.]
MTTEELRALDRSALWHPFTQQQGWAAEDAPIVERAEGAWLHDTDGRAYLDGTSALWCNVHGHRHPAIDAAVRAQLDRVAHTTMLGLSHPPAIALAEALLAIAPRGEGRAPLSRVFYSDNGSTANEIALKMAFQWHRIQEPDGRRTKFVYLDMSYHGDTIGSVSVGGIDLFHTMFRPLLFDGIRVAAGDVEGLERVLRDHGDEIAALIMEPLVQGAAGMLLHPDGYLRAVRELCDAYNVLMVVDEVATGFGRTGTMFACEREGVVPDLMSVAKGLTGGYLPLAATLTTERVYEGFLGRFEEFRTFFHGHTYTGNPLACAAALATLRVFEDEDTLAALQPKIALLAELLEASIAPLETVAEIRRRGVMVGIQLTDFPLEARMGHQVTLAARERGAIVRPLGDVVVLMPPLSIAEDELRQLVAITAEAIAAATGAGTPRAPAAVAPVV